MIASPIKATVFAENRFVGQGEYHPFRTNGGHLPIQHSSVAGFCPMCGEIWLRNVLEGVPLWRVYPVLCLKHAMHFSPGDPMAWHLQALLPPYCSQELAHFELLWWAMAREKWE